MNAIITGARRGIGRATVEEFAQNGINIWACSSTFNEEFEHDMQDVAQKYGIWVKTIYFDLNNEDAVRIAVKDIISEKKSVDFLINNAGVPYSGTMLTTPIKDLRRVLETNYISQIFLMQLIAKVMIRQKFGSIVNVASVGGIEAREGYLAYGSSKAALIWATRSISKELANYNIRVNAVAPGLIDTDMGAYKKEKEQEKIIQGISIKRLGSTEEVAKGIYFLASENASFITGTILNIDGGRIV